MASPYHRPQPPRPQRKGLATWSLVLGVLSIPCMGLFGIGALAGLILGIVALVKANREPAVYGGSGMAIGGIVTSCVGLVLLPILAAIAIPSLLRARVSANEAQAIGDIRTVISAQRTYASTNGGYFDTLDCLATTHELYSRVSCPGTGLPGRRSGRCFRQIRIRAHFLSRPSCQWGLPDTVALQHEVVRLRCRTGHARRDRSARVLW